MFNNAIRAKLEKVEEILGGITAGVKRSYAVKPFTAPRDLTTYEAKMDFGRIANDLRDADESITPALVRAARAIYSSFIDAARDRGMLRKLDIQTLQDLQPKNMRDMNIVFKNKFLELFKNAFSAAGREVHGKDYAEKRARGSALLPEQVEELIRSESFKIVGDYSMELTKRLRNIIASGVKDAAGEGAIVALLRDEAKNFTDTWLSTVVRTKTTEIYNSARRSFWENDETAKKLISAYQFSAILDERTSDVCRDLDGKIFETTDGVGRITPPLHFNCRSLLVPITKFEEYEPNAMPSVDDIQDLGGNLKKFEEIRQLSGEAAGAGDHVVLPAPGDGRRIRIHSLYVQNVDSMGPVNIGFRETSGAELEWKAGLQAGGGTFQKEFQFPWALSLNSPLFINTSSDGRVVWTVEYQS